MNEVMPITQIPKAIIQYQTFALNGCRNILRMVPVGCRNTKHGLRELWLKNSHEIGIIASKLESETICRTKIQVNESDDEMAEKADEVSVRFQWVGWSIGRLLGLIHPPV